MMRTLVLFALAAMIAITSAVDLTVNISACGNYTSTNSTPVFINYHLTQDIIANSTSTITSGACVYLFRTSLDNFRIYPDNFSITNAGSTATMGIFAYSRVGSIEILTNGSINGFDTGIFFNNTHGNDPVLNSGTATISFANATRGITCQVYNPTFGCLAGAYRINFCNVTNPAYLTFEGGSLQQNTTAVFINTCAPPLIFGNITKFAGSAGGQNIINSTSNVYLSFNLQATATGANGNINNVSLAFNETSVAGSTTKNLQFNLPSIINATDISLVNIAWSAATINGRMVYSTSTTFSNPLYFRNYSAFPFLIVVPTETTCDVQIGVPYDFISFTATSGATPYLAASAVNSEYTRVFLVVGATYAVHREYSGQVYDTTHVVANYGGVCYLVPNLGTVAANFTPILLPQGTCWQANATQSVCNYVFANSNTTPAWSMKMLSTNNSVVVCWQNATGNIGVLTCNVLAGTNAVVSLYFNGSFSSPVTGSFHSSGGTNTQYMWFFIYAGASIAVAFVSTRVPFIMAMAELTLNYLFYTSHVIDINILIMGTTIWVLILLASVVSVFKKDWRGG